MANPAGSPTRGVLALVSVLVLLVGACSSSDSDNAGTSAADDASTSAAVAAGTSEADAAGEVSPTVVCVREARAAYFGYRNTGPAPVSIPVGDANRIALDDGTELTSSQPDVFAPGEQGVVAWAPHEDPSSPPSWSITGPDGTERSAVADETSPPCPDGVPPADPPDDRDPTLVSEVDVDRSDDGGVDGATITVSLDDMPDASHCPAGTHPWSPEPPDVRIEAAGSNVTVLDDDDPSVARLEIDDPSLPAGEGFDLAGYASVTVWVDVDDRCTDDHGTTSRAWGASESLIDLSQIGVKVCFGAVDEGYDTVDCALGPTLAPTGGIRLR